MRQAMSLTLGTVLIICSLLFVSACQHSAVFKAPKGPDIIDFHVSLTPDVDAGTVFGVQKITVSLSESTDHIVSFTSGALTVLEMSVNGDLVDIQTVDGEIVVPLAPASEPDRLVEIVATYFSQPDRGYSIGESGVYTEYFACDWMICQQENFGDKATVTLELNLPAKMESVGPGSLVESMWLPNGLHRSTWRSDVAYPPYIYAFAFGNFVTAKQNAGSVVLKYVSAVVGKEQLLKLFGPTGEMLSFFEAKAGTPFPHQEYTQLYVEGGSAQEAISHSIIGERWLKPILTDPQEDWVIAHELAHQWWGNGVTCSDISEFWLNEGITVFMVAAWKEHRWGRTAYERDLQFSKNSHQRAINAGMDVPLAYDGEYPSIRIRRAIQYGKGAVFMDVLRSELGEKSFWSGLRDYTSANMGKTVSSASLQLAFERASSRDLSSLFDDWVYHRAQ